MKLYEDRTWLILLSNRLKKLPVEVPLHSFSELLYNFEGKLIPDFVVAWR